jgi:hypothetical protein
MIHVILEGDCIPEGKLDFSYATIPPPGALIQHGQYRWVVTDDPPRIDIGKNGVTFTFVHVRPAAGG